MSDRIITIDITASARKFRETIEAMWLQAALYGNIYLKRQGRPERIRRIHAAYRARHR